MVFGRLGDLWGRKNTFLVTMLLMGLSTFVVGLLPGYAADRASPRRSLLIVMRLIQGLALGGEYGGAATYVAEHAPEGKRGLYTSWIQTTATFGLFLSLIVIIVVAHAGSGEDAFKAWGWRIPFLVSVAAPGRLAVDPPAAEREPGVPEDGRRGHDLEGAADRELRALAQPEAGAAGAGRPHRRPGGGLVHRPVLQPCSSWRRC